MGIYGKNIMFFSIFFVIFLLGTYLKSDQILDTNENQVFGHNSNTLMEFFRGKDTTLVDEILKMDTKSILEADAMDKFHYLISFPVQGVCRILKRVGGFWWLISMNRAVDGDYFFCMDNLVLKKSCVIYSFGVANDWTFEDIMDDIGCEIHAHDPTVDFPAKRGMNINFYKLGIAVETGSNMETLVNILKKNGHTNESIEYLKIDIEGNELTVLPDLIANGALDNVNQLALEFHLGRLPELGLNYIWMLELLQQLYNLNFRMISYEVNMVTGAQNNYYELACVVFMKDDLWS